MALALALGLVDLDVFALERGQLALILLRPVYFRAFAVEAVRRIHLVFIVDEVEAVELLKLLLGLVLLLDLIPSIMLIIRAVLQQSVLA